MSYILWLDDKRHPFDCFKSTNDPKIIKIEINDNLHGRERDDSITLRWRGKKVVWVKSYIEFISALVTHGKPAHVCFDHDLLESHYTPEKYWGDYEASRKFQYERGFEFGTGLDCAKALVYRYYGELPTTSIHSANPIGAERISDYLHRSRN